MSEKPSIVLPRFEDVADLEAIASLADVEVRFVERVFGTPADRYVDRLHNAGLRGLGTVLDLGCGFGQWALCLAQMNTSVIGVDPAPQRVDALRQIAERLGMAGLSVFEGSGEAVPAADASVDGVFCFGVAQYVEPGVLMGEIARVLVPGGRAYVNGKDVGGYVFDWLEGRHRAGDFEPRQVTVDAFRNTLVLEQSGKLPADCTWPDRIVPMDSLVEAALEHGLQVVATGEEGSTTAPGVTRRPSDPFFPGTYRGLPNAFEILVMRP